MRYDCDRCHFHEHNMIQPYLIEAVFQRKTTLDFMRLDHGGQHAAHRGRCPPASLSVARTPVGNGKDTAQIIRWMPPFGGEPSIVEIEPADHRADIERSLYRIKLELGTGNSSAIGHSRIRNERS